MKMERQGCRAWLAPGVIFSLAIVGGMVWLVGQARQGDVASIAVLAVLASVLLILVGWGFSTLTNAMNARTEQRHFMNNVRENLAIMGAMQKVQNQQNTMLLKQAKEQQRQLPVPEGDVIDMDSLTWDEDVFSDLDNDEDNIPRDENGKRMWRL
jgi:hypothetical protein